MATLQSNALFAKEVNDKVGFKDEVRNEKKDVDMSGDGTENKGKEDDLKSKALVFLAGSAEQSASDNPFEDE